jgi:hypothetical protein
MKRLFLVMMVLVLFVVMVVGTVAVTAAQYVESGDFSTITGRFYGIDTNEAGTEFTMLSDDGMVIINIDDSVIDIYYEDGVSVRDALYGKRLADVLNRRNLVVTYGAITRSIPAQTTPISIKVLFEGFTTLPGQVGDFQGVVTIPGYVGDYQQAVTLPAEIGSLPGRPGGAITLPGEIYDVPNLNGEIVVNGKIIEAQSPYWLNWGYGGAVVMVPLRAVAEELGYDVSWNAALESVQLGNSIQLWIGNCEVQSGRMAPIELIAEPVILDNKTFVPLDFFRDVLGQSAYVFEGQLVIETNSDMF